MAIALREWRLFGSPVADDPPGAGPPRSAASMPERAPGLWQRVGEYWWLGEDAGNPTAAWTGKHDETGAEFPVSEDARYAWSAAFVSYVMRIAGAGPRFPYSASHSTYINAARSGGYALTAERPEEYAPLPGDILCATRTRSKRPRFEDLPAGPFPSHCAIVVGGDDATIAVIGGNIEDAVALTHVPADGTGRIAADPRYSWFVILKVAYAR